MRRWTHAVFAAALGIALAVPAQAQWKWRDKAGQTQYSDLPPPPGTAEQDILLRPNSGQRRAAVAAVAAVAPVAASGAPGASAASLSASGAPALKPKGSEPELEAKRRVAEQDEAAKKKAEAARQAAVRAENCSRAQGQMRSLDSGVRIARTNEKGEREVLSDTARAAETQRTREVIASDCK